MTEDDLTKYNIKNTDTYENKYIVTLKLEKPTSETVKAELEKTNEDSGESSAQMAMLEQS